MHYEHNTTRLPSHFWSCLTLNEECPFFSCTDPKLSYFAFGLTGLYITFFLMILADLKFYWSLDNFQKQIDDYINLVRRKLKQVQMDQRRLVSTQERAEKQIERSLLSKQIVTTLRSAISVDDKQKIPILTNLVKCPKISL